MTKIADAIQLFNCPGPKPNGLQATEEGLWVIDPVSYTHLTLPTNRDV